MEECQDRMVFWRHGEPEAIQDKEPTHLGQSIRNGMEGRLLVVVARREITNPSGVWLKLC